MISEDLPATERGFTVPEIVALLGLPERKVRREIALGILPESSLLGLSFAAVVGLRATAAFNLVVRLTPLGRKKVYGRIRDQLERWRPGDPLADVVMGGGFIRVNVTAAAEDAWVRVAAFFSWSGRRVTSDLTILDGQAVFVGSQLSVRHIGDLPEAERATILEDYPYLSPEDIRFARMFSRAYPRLDRPS